MLSRDPLLHVTTAADPFIAMDKMRRQRPDVILLDLQLPRMDGLTFLGKIMAEDPIPVVICSGFVEAGTDVAMKALEEGAVEIITKPKIGVKGFLEESAVLLSDTIRAAAQARLKKKTTGLTQAQLSPRPALDWVLKPQRIGVSSARIVAIGASTGGTEALRTLLQRMPADCPGIVIVQHMPERFTAAFANRLNQICTLSVKEAEDGEPVLRGAALIAPGNKHIEVKRAGATYVVEVSDGPLVSRHRPSVDVLFRSVAKAAGPMAIGVILTGMGKDGADGLLQMRQAGALTIAQDEATSAVFGMPKESIARGAVSEVVPLPDITDAILRSAHSVTGPLRIG